MSPEVHDAVVIGAGPAGLCAAAELRRLGIDTVVLERRREPKPGTRAIGVHPPALAALEASGATERMLAEAARIPRGIARSRSGRVLGEVRFDRRRTRFPFVAAVPQAVTEAALTFGAPAPVLGAEVRRITRRADGLSLLVSLAGEGATGGEAHDDVPVDLAVDLEMRARAVIMAVGASGRDTLLPGSRSRERIHADRYLMTDLAHAPGQPQDLAIITLDAQGVVESFPLPNGGRRLVAWGSLGGGPGSGAVCQLDRAKPVDRAERLRRAVADRTGETELASLVESATAFGIRRLLLPRMRSGALFVIGDAAHEVSPIGGQGMNLGLLDAATLAPALADWLREGSAETERRLARWERNRLASARTAARLASLNTGIGRARPPSAHRALVATVGAVARGPVARLAARAYAMGFDRAASR